MIVQSYPAKKQVNAHIAPTVLPRKQNTLPPFTPDNVTTRRSPTNAEVMAATKRGITIETFLKRDHIVKLNAEGCPFKAGEIVTPRKLEDQQLFGNCRILAVCNNYLDFGDEEWPSNNVPRIVHFESEEPSDAMRNKHFFGTINFFERNTGGVC